MDISESILKAHLKNVYRHGGAAGGGKSVMSDLIADKFGFKAYHPETLYAEHKALANIEDHPNIMTPFKGWEWFFNRPLEEYYEFVLGSDLEYIQMVIPDVIKLAANQTVVVDGHLLEPAFLKQVTTDDRVFFLFAEDELIEQSFYDREDKKDMMAVINTLADPDKAVQNISDLAKLTKTRKIERVEAAEYKYLIRNRDSTIKGTLETIEKHFGLRE